MQILEAIILGLVQGLTEFIPVSSSGHLIIVRDLLGFEVGGFIFDVLINIGTILALVWYFRRDLLDLITRVARHRDLELLNNIIIATIPAALAGFFLQDLAETVLRQQIVVVVMLIAVAALMLASDRLIKRKEFDDLNLKSSLVVGLAQILALVPGTSRSGITITAASLQRFSDEAAARFSFLIAIPILSGAVTKVLLSSEAASYIVGNGGVLAAGILTSFAAGYGAIWFMLRYLREHGLSFFGWYRIILGGFLLAVLFIG